MTKAPVKFLQLAAHNFVAGLGRRLGALEQHTQLRSVDAFERFNVRVYAAVMSLF
jgi:hypothetical protein